MTSTEKDKMLAGDLYNAGAPELQADMAAAHEWLARYNAALGTSISERRELLLERFAAVGEVCTAHRKWLRVSHMIQPIRVRIERGLVAADHKIGRFATDSLLEEGGFEPSVPRQQDLCKDRDRRRSRAPGAPG
jgi:hypothetical protein